MLVKELEALAPSFASSSVCLGIRGNGYRDAYHMPYGGRMQPQLIWQSRFTVDRLGYATLGAWLNGASEASLHAAHAGLNAVCPGSHGLLRDFPSWRGCGDCVRSMFCDIEHPILGEGMCEACVWLSKDENFVKRNHGTDGTYMYGARTRNDLLPIFDLRSRRQRDAITKRTTDRLLIRADSALRRMAKDRRTLLDRLEQAGMSANLPKFMTLFWEAQNAGKFVENHLALVDILNGIAHAVLHGSRAGVPLTTNEQAFYSCILNVGGAWMTDFVSENLGYPVHTRTVRKASKALVNMTHEYGTRKLEEQVKQVAGWVKEMSHTKRGVICEDGSSFLKQLESEGEERDKEDGKWNKVTVWGLVNGPHSVSSLNELTELFDAKKIPAATTLYALLWAPLEAGAKALPLCILCHDNSNKYFNSQDMVKLWKALWSSLDKHGLQPVAHYGDGDSRFRSAVWHMTMSEHTDLQTVHLGHPLCFMKAVLKFNARISFGIDPLHIDWRILRQYVSCNRNLLIGGQPAESRQLDNLQRSGKAKMGITFAHTDYRNPTNWKGVLMLADLVQDPKTGELREVENVRLVLARLINEQKLHLEGSLMFLEFFHRHVRMTWLKKNKPLLVFQDAVYCMTFVLVCEEWVLLNNERQGVDDKCFLTQQTCDDVFIQCHEVLLGLAEQCLDVRGKHEPFIADRRTSRWCEYLFGDMRMSLRGQMKFTTKRAIELIRRSMVKYVCEMTTDVKFKHRERTQSQAAETTNAPEMTDDYWVSVDEFGTLIDGEIANTLKELRNKGFDLSSFQGGARNAGLYWRSWKSLANRKARFERGAAKVKAGEEIDDGGDENDANMPRGRPDDETEGAEPQVFGQDRDMEEEEQSHLEKRTWDMEECERLSFVMGEKIREIQEPKTNGAVCAREEGNETACLLEQVKEAVTAFNARMPMQSRDRIGGNNRFVQKQILGTVVRKENKEGLKTVSDGEMYAAMEDSTTLDSDDEEVKTIKVHIGQILAVRYGPPKKQEYVDRVKWDITMQEHDKVQLKTRWLTEQNAHPIRNGKHDCTYILPHRGTSLCEWVPYEQYLSRVRVHWVKDKAGGTCKVNEEDRGTVAHYVYRHIAENQPDYTWEDPYFTHEHYEEHIKPGYVAEDEAFAEDDGEDPAPKKARKPRSDKGKKRKVSAK